MGEKIGTHLNAPSTYQHYRNNASWTVDQLPLSSLVHVPAVIIDNPSNRHGVGRSPSSGSRSHMVSQPDLERWEEQHGKIPVGAIVIFRTGWEKYWLHPDKFFGKFADQPNQVFPGFTVEAVAWLMSARMVSGIGTECVDVELPAHTGNAVKQLLAARNKFSLVQMANLHQIPVNSGFHLTIAPLKLRGGSGGPARVFATVSMMTSSAAGVTSSRGEPLLRNLRNDDETNHNQELYNNNDILHPMPSFAVVTNPRIALLTLLPCTLSTLFLVAFSVANDIFFLSIK